MPSGMATIQSPECWAGPGRLPARWKMVVTSKTIFSLAVSRCGANGCKPPT